MQYTWKGSNGSYTDAAILIGGIVARASSCELGLDMGRRF
jgi:hypothetical protein